MRPFPALEVVSVKQNDSRALLFNRHPNRMEVDSHRHRGCNRKSHDLSSRTRLRRLAGCPLRHDSTGGKQWLFGMSKRGNIYLRRMLIHGACAVLFRVKYDTAGFG
jgi:hypothetical protein